MDMFPLPGYPDGSDLMVLQVDYSRPRKITDERGKEVYSKDFVTIIFKDNKTGKKGHHVIYNPTYTYYILKDEYQTDYVKEYEDMNKLRPVTCLYRELTKSIAEQTGNMDVFISNIRQGQYRLNDMFKIHPRVFGCDLNIQTYIRTLFAEHYTNNIHNTSVVFYDIETDDKDSATPSIKFPGANPINAITMYERNTKILHNFVLINHKIPDCFDLGKELRETKPDTGIYKKSVDFIYENIGGIDKVKKYNMYPLDIESHFFENEGDMLVSFFDKMHEISPDFAVAYNASFDFINLKNRLENLGYDPKEVICDHDFTEKYCYYFVDERNINDYAERNDYCCVSAYTVYIDQMVLYASRRKGRSAIENFKLDTIGAMECGVHKVSYMHITTDFTQFCYLDFKLFWLYNLFDTMVQACIEAETDDLNFMLSMVIEMNTPYSKIFRQTNYLMAKAYQFYKQHGMIMGDNPNQLQPPPEVILPGAFVANPNKMDDTNKQTINGYPIYKFKYAIDFDFAALYPNMIIQFNLGKSTQIGLINVLNPKFKDPPYLKTTNGGTLCENLVSQNWIAIGNRWLGLPDVERMEKLMDEYFTQYQTPSYKKSNNPLPMDKKVIMTTKSTPTGQLLMTHTSPKMPEWLKRESNKIRQRIVMTDVPDENQEIIQFLNSLDNKKEEE